MKSAQLTGRQLLRLILAEFRGARRRFVFFVFCIAIGVGAVMTVTSFSSLLNQSILKESKSLLAADLEIKGSWEQSAADLDFQKKALPEGTAFQFIKELHAMSQFSRSGTTASLLVELKSVPTSAPLYPMYGVLTTEPQKPLPELLANGGAVVGPSFLVRTGLKIGDTFTLGKARLRLTATVLSEPDRISRAFSIGPRMIVSAESLSQAELIQPGSRIRHKTLIRLPATFDLEKALVILERGLTDKSADVRTYKDMQSSLISSIERIGQYLGAVGVIALLMGGIGVAMIIRTFMAQKLDTIAILNCIGASSRTIFSVYLAQSLLLGLIGSLLGVATGYALQYLLPAKLAGLLNIAVDPAFTLGPAMQSLAMGVAVTLLFCLWPLLKAARTRPLRLLRRNFEEDISKSSLKEQIWPGLFSFIGLALIVFWQAGSVKRGALFVLAVGASTLILAGISYLALKLLKRLPTPGSITRRYGLANLYRPNNQAVSIVTCLGMGIMLILTVRLVQMDMLAMLKKDSQIRPPNYFFIDIQTDQVGLFSKAMQNTAPEATYELTPLIRARLYSAGGQKISEWHYEDRQKEEWFINREFVLTHRVDMPEKGNSIVQGKWWTPEEASTPQVSLEEDAARRLGVTIGSELTLDILGIKVTAPVTSIRKVDWRNMRTNFYMIYSPGALAGAPVTFVASVYVAPEKELPLQHAVVGSLPNVTALSTRDIVTTIETVVEKLKTLVDFMSAFTIAAGLIILSGSIASTKYRRMKESAILKVLGARRQAVATVLGIEYATLGTIASIVGIGLSLALSWAVMKYLVKSPWHLYPEALTWTFVLSILLTILTGVFSSLDVLKNKPLKTLREL